MIKSILLIFLIVVNITFNLSFAKQIELQDLGFKESDTKINPRLDKILKSRESLLSTHQILGLATLVLMSATYLTGEEGDELEEGKTELGATSTHKVLGIASGLAYFTAATFALITPRQEPAVKDRGSSKWHKRLAWIHFPAMVLTTTLGLVADNQFKKGKKINGLLAQKSLVANIAFFSLAAAGITMTVDF